MESYIKRDLYLRRLIDRRENGEVKIITGPRRCGKSWLLRKIYRDYLLENGVRADDIASYIDEDGIAYISLMQFLQSETVL